MRYQVLPTRGIDLQKRIFRQLQVVLVDRTLRALRPRKFKGKDKEYQKPKRSKRDYSHLVTDEDYESPAWMFV